MSKLRILIAALIVFTLFLLPSIAMAQPDVCGFYGSVTLDGDTVADGTTVKAWVEGQAVASTTTADSAYVMNINSTGQDYPGKTVTFTVGEGDGPATQTEVFTKGANIKLDLTASTAIVGNPSLTLSPVKGTATNVCGADFARNQTVWVYFGSDLIATTTTDSEGKFCVPAIPTTGIEGKYDISAQDVMERSASASFELSAPEAGPGGTGDKGDTGDTGDTGPAGPAGPAGEDGDDGGSSTIGIIAIIIAVIAIILTIVFRVMKPAAPAEG
jgi:hypothetical protein